MGPHGRMVLECAWGACTASGVELFLLKWAVKNSFLMVSDLSNLSTDQRDQQQQEEEEET